MFDFTAKLMIDTSVDALWQRLTHIKSWWLASNPEHISLEILAEDYELHVGTPIRIRERIAGIPGEATGQIQTLEETREITWVSDDAMYRFWGLPLSVKEGVTWRVEPQGDHVQLSAHVWAEFPETWFGGLVEWFFKHVINGVDKDYEHAMTELRYLKETMDHQ
jgi:hypothetical protein